MQEGCDSLCDLTHRKPVRSLGYTQWALGSWDWKKLRKKQKSQMGAVKLHSDMLLAHLSRKLENKFFFFNRNHSCLGSCRCEELRMFPLAVVGDIKQTPNILEVFVLCSVIPRAGWSYWEMRDKKLILVMGEERRFRVHTKAGFFLSPTTIN